MNTFDFNIPNRECMNFNYTDMSNIINSCSKKQHKYNRLKYIDQGSYSMVYNAKSKNENVIVKISKSYEKHIPIFTSEINLAVYLGEHGIGPKIYDYFYIKRKRAHSYYQIIIMEKFKESLNHYIRNKYVSPDRKCHAINKMIELLRKLIMDHNIFCTDTKLGNCVYKWENQGDIKIRLIDFGNNYCYKTPLKGDKITQENKILFFNYVLLQNAYDVCAHLNMDCEYIMKKTFLKIKEFRKFIHNYRDIYNYITNHKENYMLRQLFHYIGDRYEIMKFVSILYYFIHENKNENKNKNDKKKLHKQ